MGRSNNGSHQVDLYFVLDQHQVIKMLRLKVKDVHNMENGLRIIVECDEYGVPVGKTVGIITGVMGQLATNPLYFPISFKKWPDMPKSCLDCVFDDILMAQFLFRIDYQKAKRWISGNLNKKCKDHKHKLWHAAEDPLLSKEEIIRKSPNGIPLDQWALFINYRMDEKIKKLCKKNQQIRQNQIPHTGGAKSLARRRAKMKAKEKDVDRGNMWTETHKRKDGSYVTEAAREIGVSILPIDDYLSSYRSCTNGQCSLLWCYGSSGWLLLSLINILLSSKVVKLRFGPFSLFDSSLYVGIGIWLSVSVTLKCDLLLYLSITCVPQWLR